MIDASRPFAAWVIVRSSLTPAGAKLVQVAGLTGQLTWSGAHFTITSDSRIVMLPVPGSLATETVSGCRPGSVWLEAGLVKSVAAPGGVYPLTPSTWIAERAPM